MDVLGNPGIAETDFEQISLAVSAVDGCGMRMNSRDTVLKKHGVAREAIQSAVRIGSVIPSVAGVLAYGGGCLSVKAGRILGRCQVEDPSAPRA